MFEEKADYSLIFGLNKINIKETYNQILNSNPIKYYDDCNNELYIYNLNYNNKIDLTNQKEY